MVTTFFGPHSFGGDAAYVDRLSRALLRRGHEVEVIYNVDAFEAVRGPHPLRSYQAPPGLRLHTLQSPWKQAGVLWAHQTGHMGWMKAALQKRLDSGGFDVIHFHNISLLGGLQLLTLRDPARKAVRVMTAHEHWLLCPLSLLWKFDRDVCDRPTCMRCTLAAGRPPQLWRKTNRLQHALADLDALIVPSQHTQMLHQTRGVERGITVLPYFLPDETATLGATAKPWRAPDERPYFAVAGRLIKEKGFQQVIALMPHLTEADLLIAGTGPYEAELRQQAADIPNVQFLGLLAYPELTRLYRGARALVVPSLFYETFGYVVLEAFSAATPVIVRDRGPLPEFITKSDAGFVYQTDTELLNAMQRLAQDQALPDRLGLRGLEAYRRYWSETDHVERYLSIIRACRS